MTLHLTALTSIQKQRRARKSRPKLVQFDMFGEPPAAPSVVVAQSPRAAAIAEETAMRTEAQRVLAAKAGKAGKVARKAKAPAAKPSRVRRVKP